MPTGYRVDITTVLKTEIRVNPDTGEETKHDVVSTGYQEFKTEAEALAAYPDKTPVPYEYELSTPPDLEMEEWQAELDKASKEIPNHIENIIDAMPVAQVLAMSKETIDPYDAKKEIRDRKPVRGV